MNHIALIKIIIPNITNLGLMSFIDILIYSKIVFVLAKHNTQNGITSCISGTIIINVINQRTV